MFWKKGQPLLNGTLYAANNYFVLNWNDVASGLASQFVLLVGNNAYLLSSACASVTGAGSRAFFYAFWIVNVLVLLNLFFALIFRVVDLAKASDNYVAPRLDLKDVRDNVIENEELSPMISLQAKLTQNRFLFSKEKKLCRTENTGLSWKISTSMII
jgi:hypothetical protein